MSANFLFTQELRILGYKGGGGGDRDANFAKYLTLCNSLSTPKERKLDKIASDFSGQLHVVT